MSGASGWKGGWYNPPDKLIFCVKVLLKTNITSTGK